MNKYIHTQSTNLLLTKQKDRLLKTINNYYYYTNSYNIMYMHMCIYTCTYMYIYVLIHQRGGKLLSWQQLKMYMYSVHVYTYYIHTIYMYGT